MEETKDSFLVYLPSNASMYKFPNNTPSDYQVELNRPIQLSGEWEVGVSSVCYDSAIENKDTIEEISISATAFDMIPLNDADYEFPYNVTKDGKWNYDPIQLDADNFNLDDMNSIVNILNSGNSKLMKDKNQKVYDVNILKWGMQKSFYQFKSKTSGLTIKLPPKLSVHLGFGHGQHLTQRKVANSAKQDYKNAITKTSFYMHAFDENLVECEEHIILKPKGVKALTGNDLVRRWNETITNKYGEKVEVKHNKMILHKYNSKLTFIFSAAFKRTSTFYTAIIGRGSFYGIDKIARSNNATNEEWSVYVYADRLKRVPAKPIMYNYSLPVTPRREPTVNAFIQVLNPMLENKLKEALDSKYNTKLHNISFSIEDQRVVLQQGTHMKCRLSSNLMKMFGFSQQILVDTHHKSLEPPMTLDKREQYLYIESDLIPPVLFGDKKEYILRDFVHDKDASYGIIEKNFYPIFFHPVIKQTIPSISIKITNALRECIHLRETKSLIVLVFRKAK